MNITQAIQEMYPSLEPGRDFLVRDDGKGPYLAEWNNPNPRPTNAQLAEAWFRVAVKRKAAEFTERQVAEIESGYRSQVKSDKPNAWLVEMLVDIAQSVRTVDQTQKLKNAADQRVKRDKGHGALALKSPGTNPLAAADQVLAMRWEDIV